MRKEIYEQVSHRPLNYLMNTFEHFHMPFFVVWGKQKYSAALHKPLLLHRSYQPFFSVEIFHYNFNKILKNVRVKNPH